MDRSEMIASMTEQFLTSWTSSIFRERCAAQIEYARCEADPQENSDDLVEKFLAQKSSKELEEFVFEQSKCREDYLSLVSEMLMMLRQHRSKSTVTTQQLDRYSVVEEEEEEAEGADVFQGDDADVKTNEEQD